MINGQETEILAPERPQAPIPYMILYRIENNDDIKGIYLIYGKSIDGKVLDTSVGRGSSNGIDINDISVSRHHANITFQDGKFKLYDKNSKFGTLAEVKEPLELGMSKLALQCGRTVVILNLIVKESAIKLANLMALETSMFNQKDDLDAIQDRVMEVGDIKEDEQKDQDLASSEEKIMGSEDENDDRLSNSSTTKNRSLIEASRKIKKIQKETNQK